MTTERIHFRLLVMPCCSTMLCWVNPRLPNYCPECGTNVMAEIKSCVMADDDGAVLKYREGMLGHPMKTPLQAAAERIIDGQG